MNLLSDIELFVEVAKAGSYRKAASKISVPNSTLSRRIAELEKKVGLPLFKRTTRLVELTEAGRMYFNRCNNLVEDARAALDELTHLAERPTGRLRVTAPVEFSITWLCPIIVEFLADYPEIELDLELTPEVRNLLVDKNDIAIRMGIPKEQDLFVRKIATKETGLFASPDYVCQRENPKAPEDLARHKCVVFRKNEFTLTNKTTAASVIVPVQAHVRVNNVMMLKNLSISGLGISLIARELARADVEAGKLTEVLWDWQGPPVNVYAVTTARVLPAKSRIFLEYLIEKINLIF